MARAAQQIEIEPADEAPTTESLVEKSENDPNFFEISERADPTPEAAVTSPNVKGEKDKSRFYRILLVAFVLAISVAIIALAPTQFTNQLVLLFLGLFATVGVLAAFYWAIGSSFVASRSADDQLTRLFVDNLNEGICLTDASDRIVFANPAYRDLIGADNNVLLRSVETVFSRDPDAADAVYRINHSLLNGQAGFEEVRLPISLRAANTTKSDTSQIGEAGYWYSLRAKTVERPGGEELKIWRIADITDNRKTQESIFRELQTAIDYLDHAPVGFVSVNPDGTLAYLNATLADWLGIDIAAIRPGDIHLYDIVDTAGAAHLLASDGSVVKPSGNIFDLDMINDQGQSVAVRLIHNVPVDADGNVKSTRSIVLNRASDTGSNDALQSAEIRFSRFFNNSPIAIASVMRDRRLGRCNGQFVRLFGHKNVEGRQADFVNSVIERDRPALRAALTSAINGKSRIEPVEVTLAAQDDDESKQRFVKIFVSGVEANDENEAATIFALDTTEQRALEEQFSQSQKMQAVGQLAGGVAHDFNNVLTAIIGFSDLLLASHKPSDPSFPDIMNIKQNANRAAGLVRQLLAFSRRQTLRPQVLQLSDVMTEVSVMLDRLLGEKVVLEVHHGRDLWPVKADLNQFEQVIMNLAVNARDAMPDGGTVNIRTRNMLANEVDPKTMTGAPIADYVLVEVADDGVGMNSDVAAKVFEPFFTTKAIGQGTGLGLSTVYGIIKQTGGYIYLHSEEGVGTNFKILLPRHIEEESDAEESISDGPPRERERTDLTGSASILLVEDEEAVRAFSARALTGRGYTVHEAMTGTEALEVMDEIGGRVDLVISDVMMPEMDGPTLLRELRKTNPDLKIIFVSGYAEDAFAKSLDEDDVFSFLPKPFSLKQLAMAVKDALEE